MNRRDVTLLMTGIWMSVGHFLYQVIFGLPDFSVAAERSYFTFMTVFVAWLSLRVGDSK